MFPQSQPDEAIEGLMAMFWAPPPVTLAEYEIIQRDVEREMQESVHG